MARYDDSGFIIELDKNEIFVFGSNLAGRHGAGAALQAAKEFGAQYGVGEGLTGLCYAFPTLDGNLQKLDWEQIQASRDNFYRVCRLRPDLTFLLTKVGCGMAGYPEESMASLFFHPPQNVVRPEDWI